MQFLGMGILTWITFLPVVGMAVVLLLGKDNKQAIRWTAAVFTGIQVVLAAVIYVVRKRRRARFVEELLAEQRAIEGGGRELFTGRKAAEMGLVNEAVPREKLRERVRQLADLVVAVAVSQLWRDGFVWGMQRIGDQLERPDHPAVHTPASAGHRRQA